MYSAKSSQHASPRCPSVARRNARPRDGRLRRPLTVVHVAADRPAAAESDAAVSSAVAALKSAARDASVPAKTVFQAMIDLEKQQLSCDGLVDYLTNPGSRWKLVYTILPKAVVAGYKGDTKASGSYIPFPAVLKFDKDPTILTNGLFLGSLAYMMFAGPFQLNEKNKNKLDFDLTFMTLGVGPFKATVPLKKDSPLVDIIAKANGNQDLLRKKMPFLLCAYADEEIFVARGAQGGVALYAVADSEWQAKSGVLRVMQ